MWITLGCLGCCWAVSQGLSIFPCSAREEVHRKLGWSTSRTADLSYHRNIPHHRIPYPVYKLGRLLGRGANCSLGMGWALVSEGWAIILWCITCLFWVSLCLPLPFTISFVIILLLLWFYFVSITKLFISQPQSSIFSFVDSPLHPTGAGRGTSCAVLCCQLGLNPDVCSGSRITITTC